MTLTYVGLPAYAKYKVKELIYETPDTVKLSDPVILLVLESKYIFDLLINYALGYYPLTYIS